MLRRFRESWADSGISALEKLERRRAFARFAHESGWIDEDPTRHIKNPKVANPPTMPFTQEETIAILAACDRLPTTAKWAEKTAGAHGPLCSCYATAV